MGKEIKTEAINKETIDRFLSNREDMLRTIFNTLQDAIFLVTSDRKLVKCNEAATTIFGYSQDELFSLSTGALHVNQAHYEEFGRRINNAFQQDKIAFFEFEAKRKSGQIFPTEHTVTQIKTDDGQILGILSVVRDITDKKQIEEGLRKSQQLLEDTGRIGKVGGWEFNIDTGKQTWSKGVYDIHEVDYDYDPTVNKGIGFYTQESRPFIAEAVKQAIEQGEPFDVELEIKTAKGNLRKVHAIGNPDLENRSVHGFFQDITERKIAETLLRESIEELDAFVQTVAHDLRAPITPIMGYAEILREHYKNQLDEQGLSFLSEIENAGAEMLSLMEDLLSLAHTGTLERPVEPVSTDEIVARVIKNLGANITSTGVVLQVSPLPLVRVPKTYLTQIFDNLISNALRYGGKNGGLVEVGGEQAGKQIRFFVRDHGPGLSEQERKRVFEIFFRGDNKGEGKGSGIGLAIVYKVARNCGGRAWVEETPGGGCTFWVEMDDEIQDK